MASNSLNVEFCCICQEEYDSQPDLDLLRPDSCPTHWCHRDCLNDWLKNQKRCPTCLADCSSAVDKHGKISAEGGRSAQLEPTMIDPVLLHLEGVLLHEGVIDYYRSTRRCFLCPRPMEIPMVFIEPCNHRYHSQCLLRHISRSKIYQCPNNRCRKMIAVISEITRNVPPISVVYYDPTRINHPRYANLRIHLGLTEPASTKSANTKPAPCALCGQIQPALARVLPTNCPGKHIVHEECMDQFAGTESIRRCPVDGCGRQFLSVTRIPPPVSRAIGNQTSNQENVLVAEIRRTMSTPANIGKCKGCNQDLTQVEAVRPNVCQHQFHRECLIRVTNHNRKCPVRKCGRKFRSIVSCIQ